MKRDFIRSLLIKAFHLGLSFVMGVIVARCLGAEGRGLIAVYFVSLQLILSLTNWGATSSFSYFMSKKGYSIQDISSIQSILYLLTSFISVIALVIIYYEQDILSNWIITLLVLASIFPQRYIGSTNAFALSQRNIAKLNYAEIIPVIVEFVLVVVFVLFLNGGLVTYFLIVLISNLANALHAYLWVRNIEGYRFFVFDFKLFKEKGWPVVRKGFEFALPLFVMSLNYRANVLIINHFMDKKDVGIFSVAMSLSLLLWTIPDVLKSIIFSYSVSSKDPVVFSHKLWQNTLKLMIATLPLIVFIGVAAPYFIPFFYGSEFVSASTALIILLPGTYLMVFFKLLNGDLAARGFPLVAMKVFSVSALANIAANIIMIPRLGIIGAAIASSVCYAFAALYYTWDYYRLTFRTPQTA